MASKVSNLLKIYGRMDYDAGAHLYHAKDGTGPDGAYNKDARHRVRKALYKMRLRASGMTDDILGSKETDGSWENPYEQKPGK
jgi:hypothetical protein